MQNKPLKIMFRLLNFYRIIKSGLERLNNKIIFKVFNVSCKSFSINGVVSVKGRGKIIIGANFSGNSGKDNNPIGGDTYLRLVCVAPGIIRIGNNVGISNSTIYCTTGVEICDNVMIGGGSKIWDTNFHSLDTNDRVFNGDNNIKSSKIYIKKNAFIGGGVTILKGVEIGENSIVAAGSVVVKNIPNNEIWGGNPAKFLKKINNS
jgi:acetyltransferase-like isoleucine patch superfamily enzyme